MSENEIDWLMFPNKLTIHQTTISWNEFATSWIPEYKILLVPVWRLAWSKYTGLETNTKKSSLELSSTSNTPLSEFNLVWNDKHGSWKTLSGEYKASADVVSALYFKENRDFDNIELRYWYGVVVGAQKLGILTKEKSTATNSQLLFGSTTGIPPVPLKGLLAPIQKQIYMAWRTEKFMVLTGGTGVGKTSQIPKILFWFNYLFGPRKNVDLGKTWEPSTIQRTRRIALCLPRVELVKQVSTTLLKGLGLTTFEGSPIIPKFGNMEQGSIYQNHTKVTHAIEICTHRIGIKNYDKFEFIIVDEIHEHDTFADILISIAKKAPKESLQTLMSATIEDDRDRLREFLNPKFIHIEGKSLHAVKEIIMSKRIVDMADGEPYLTTDEKVFSAIEKYPPENGKVGILFMARVAQCVRYYEILRAKFPGIVFIIIHGSIPYVNDVLNRVTGVGLDHAPQILISTPYLESSITIPNATHVYDTGTCWRVLISGGEEVPINQGMSDQRRGRVGRVAPGTYVKLFHETQTWNKIDGEFLYPYVLTMHPYNAKLEDLYIQPRHPERWEDTQKYLMTRFPIDKLTLSIYNRFQCNLIEFISVYRSLSDEEQEYFALWDSLKNEDGLNTKNKRLLKNLNLNVELIKSTYVAKIKKFRNTLKVNYGPEKRVTEMFYSDTEIKNSNMKKIHQGTYV